MMMLGVLSLLCVVNIATGRYQLAAAVLAAAVIVGAFSWCFGPPAPARGPPPVVRLSTQDQRTLANSVRANSPQTPGKDHHVMIPRNGSSKIEAVFRRPTNIPSLSSGKRGGDGDGRDVDSANATTCFVLTHPWAILGGDFDNNVPQRLGFALSQYGYATCRFNFRGVGRSTGCCTWRGHGERDDLKAVVDWLCEEQGMVKIVLVGYSYGSMISNSCADMRDEITAFVSISTPFPCYWGLSLFNCARMLQWAQSSDKPKLFICGNQDQFTSANQYRRYVRSFPVGGGGGDADRGARPMACYLLMDVDHFWYGQEMAACGLILKFFKKRPELVGRPESKKKS